MTASRAVRVTLAAALFVAASCSDGDQSSGTTVALAPIVLRPPSKAEVTEPPVVTAATTTGNVPTIDTAAPGADDSVTTVPVTTVPVTTSTTSTTTSTTTTTLPPTPVTLSFTGEIWAQKGVVNAAMAEGAVAPDFAPMFAEIGPYIAASDLAFCHLETPQSPIELITAIASAGYDRCSTASEHVFDGGVEVLNATATAFDDNGLTQSGIARTPDEINSILMEVKGVRIAHLAYTLRYDVAAPVGEEWRSALIDVPRIITDATKAREAGAEMVVLSLHWGNADSARPNPDQRRWADEVTRAGVIDLIVGTHSHVVQPIEQVNGVWVAFSLGNSLTYMPTNSQWSKYTQDGIVVSFTASRGSDGRIVVEAPVVRPTFVDKAAGCVIRDVLGILADPAAHDASLVKAAQASYNRTTQILGAGLLATN